MTTNRDVPADWVDLLEAAGFVDTRAGKYSGRPSMRKLADAAGTTTTTVSEMMHGSRVTSPEVVERVADALVQSTKTRTPDALRKRVHLLVGRAIHAPFRAHPDADLLDPQEQAAINELIRLWALSKKSAEEPRLRSVALTDDVEAGAAEDETS